jgi:nitroreductase
MNKPANTDHNIHELIANRWSPRAFADKPIAATELASLFEAARWAPSSMNEQPWRFIYALKGELAHDQIVNGLVDSNKIWAKEAPVLLITLIKKNYSRNGKLNASAAHDLGLAMGNMNAQATHLGIALHYMGGIIPDKLIASFDLPEDAEPKTVVSLGYYGEPDQLSDELKQRELAERQRNPIDAFAFHGNYRN